MKKTIKNSMLMSFMILIILTACIISGFHFYQTYKYTHEEGISEIEKESKLVMKELENLLGQIGVAQYQIIDILLQDGNVKNTSENREKRNLDEYKRTEEELLSFRRSCTFIQDIFWVPADSWFCSTQDYAVKDKLLSGEAMEQAEEGSKQPYVSVHPQDYLLEGKPSPYVFSYVKKIYSIYNVDEVRGILQIDFKYQELVNILEVINSNPNALAYITDQNQKLVSFPDMKKIGKKENQGDQYKKDRKINGNSYKKEYPLSNGWNLKVYMNQESVNKNLRENLKISVILIIIFLVGASIYAYGVSKKITYPLRLLTKNLTEMEKSGQMNKIQIYSPWEEMQILAARYNDLTERLDSMIETTAQARNQLLQAKLTALQMQINPHFLSNCFGMIWSQALQSQKYEIKKGKEALAMMYRYVLNDVEKEVYLEDEIQYVKNYVRIQEFRFGESVQMFYRIDKEAANRKIPGLTIQPLVENAFKHGFRDNREKIIIIECIKKAGCILVAVRDNGVGIPEEKLEQLQKMLKTGETSEKTEKKNGGIGLRNVNDRLKLCCGQKAGLNIESTLGKGTKVSFQMEVQDEDEDIDC